MQRLAGIDRRTAFFATAAAGITEMAVVATQKGADSSIVAVVAPGPGDADRGHGAVPGDAVRHARRDPRPSDVRIRCRGAAARRPARPRAVRCSAWSRPLKIPNTWLLVPARSARSSPASASGRSPCRKRCSTAAQVVIGIWLGCRFRRDSRPAAARHGFGVRRRRPSCRRRRARSPWLCRRRPACLHHQPAGGLRRRA